MKNKREVNLIELNRALTRRGCRPLKFTAGRSGSKIVINIELPKAAPDDIIKDLKNHYCNTVIIGSQPLPVITII